MALTEMVEECVKNLVSEPDAVTVDENNDRGTMVYNVTVAPNDVGRVIGKDGRVVSAIRQMISAAGSKAGKRTVVKINAD
ncbi:MAG: KH domain-containing protein [Armatimonadetes bacterium]|nr:KH domain-containing protein [Armatimonadota bacterium]